MISNGPDGLVVNLKDVKAETRVILKKCTKCGGIKEIHEFGSNSTSSDGRQSYCRSCRNALHKQRRTDDLGRRIRHHFCTRITYQLKLAGSLAPEGLFGALEGYLGYKIWQLEAHLHLQVKTEYGVSLKKALTELGYHIDHRRPLSSFPVKEITDQAFRDCWAISNLKAIPAADNLAKGARYDPTEVESFDSTDFGSVSSSSSSSSTSSNGT